MDEVIKDSEWESKARLCESEAFVKGALEAVEKLFEGRVRSKLGQDPAGNEKQQLPKKDIKRSFFDGPHASGFATVIGLLGNPRYTNR